MTGSLNILVVEDNEVNQLMTRGALEYLGHRVTIAPDGVVAVELAHDEHFDVVLMDLMMPGITGYEASRTILSRARERGGPLPKIWAHTAEISDEDIARCRESGINRWLSKPIDPDEFAGLCDEGPLLQNELFSRVKNVDALRKVAQLYGEGYPQRLKELRQAVAERHSEAALRVTHTLKGNLLNFSAPVGARLAQELEALVGSGNWEQAAAVLPEFETACREVEQALSELIAEPLEPPRETTRLRSEGTETLVLVADADDANRAVCATALQNEGYRVVEAHDGQEVLELLESEPVAVVLMGVVMDRLGGFEACRQVKANPRTQMIPVLLVTALEEPSARIDGMDAGADDFINKPIDPREVSLRVRNAARGKSLYDQLHTSFEELQRLEQLRDGLTHMLVHDLRTPLTAIKGYATLLSSSFSAGMSEQQQKFAQKIVSQSNRLVDMVSEILDVSKLESDEMPLDIGAVNLSSLCRELSEEWAGIPENQLVLEAVPGIVIQADGELLSRVLSNLLSNAFKYTPADKPVTVRLLKSQGEVEIQVLDQGPGVPDEFKQKIFEKFGQVSGSEHKRAQSSGLGLAFCQLVVEKHGGSIGVRDGSDGGRVFWLKLPVYQPV